MKLAHLLPRVCDLARQAGCAILGHYRTVTAVRRKADDSPITAADREAHDIICAGLAGLTRDIPVLSEESDAIDPAARRRWERFWLVDPLDGTKEFIKETDEFTVNIALVQGDAPCLGVLYAPARDDLYFATAGAAAAYRALQGGAPQPIRSRRPATPPLTVVASRSHAGAAVQSVLDRLPGARTITMGSALKIGLIAAGEADLYPRLGPTMEWDTAAAQCIVQAAGGAVLDLQGRPLRYNKADLHNPRFVCVGDPDLDWKAFLS
ncbi:MAG: 3'(2'),5'-bisphosphate nucleotidase CysQ [Acidobacteriota bacterium]